MADLRTNHVKIATSRAVIRCDFRLNRCRPCLHVDICREIIGGIDIKTGIKTDNIAMNDRRRTIVAYKRNVGQHVAFKRRAMTNI